MTFYFQRREGRPRPSLSVWGCPTAWVIALQVGSDYAERKYSPGVWPKVMRNAEINALGLS
jgi:hypothetical protein